MGVQVVVEANLDCIFQIPDMVSCVAVLTKAGLVSVNEVVMFMVLVQVRGRLLPVSSHPSGIHI